MKKLVILFIIPVFFGFKKGQEIDEKKMNRDLEVAKNILATLIKSDSQCFIRGASIEASYIKDYGVIFTIPEHLVYFYTGPNAVISIPEISLPEMDVIVDVRVDGELNEMEKEMQEEIEEEMQIVKKSTRHSKVEAQRSMKEAQRSMQEAQIALAETHVIAKSGRMNEIDWEPIMITFLADYADLIGQLEPNEKIVINQKSPYDELVYVWSGTNTGENNNDTKAGLSVEVLRKDVKAYKMGKINRDEFERRLVIKKNEPQKKVADLEMFASIFDRYYSYDLSETYYSNGKPRYEVLDGFGAVFHVKASSAHSSNGRIHFYGSRNTWRMETDNDETNDEELYPKFKDDVKAFMLDYGRTIRSLNDDDKIMLEIKINTCRDCQIPKTLEVSSKVSLLKQYDQQKISREKAMAEIEIKERF